MAATGTPTTNLGLRIMNGTDPVDVADINANSQTLDSKVGAIPSGKSAQSQIVENAQAIVKVQNGLAYIVGNTNTTGGTLAVGQFVYVKNHSTIAEGVRRVTASISANGDITTSNTSACPEGGLNALNSEMAVVSLETYKEWSSDIDIKAKKIDHIVHVSGWILLSNITYDSTRPCLVIPGGYPLYNNIYVFDNEGTVYLLKQSSGGTRAELYFNSTQVIATQKYVFFNFTYIV